LVAEGRSFEGLTPAEWQQLDPRFGPDIVDRITAAASVRAKRTPQSTHPDAVTAALADTRAWIGGHPDRPR
jgi:hypothetical protein